MTTTHTLIKYRDSYPAPPWVGYCDNCDAPDGYGPASTHGYTETEIDQWFYEHTIQGDAR